MMVSQCWGLNPRYPDHFNWLNAHLGCYGWYAYLILYIYIYIYIKGTKVLDHYGSSILVTPHASVNIVKMVN